VRFVGAVTVALNENVEDGIVSVVSTVPLFVVGSTHSMVTCSAGTKPVPETVILVPDGPCCGVIVIAVRTPGIPKNSLE
jgi:hypothetical protein